MNNQGNTFSQTETQNRVNPFQQIVQQKQQGVFASGSSQPQNQFIQQPQFSSPPSQQGTAFQGFQSVQQQQQSAFQTPQKNRFANVMNQNQSVTNVSNANSGGQSGFTYQTTASQFNRPALVDNNSNSVYYSNLSELNQQEIDAFKQNSFKIGQIPYNPPSKEFCL
jgi:nucleoporin-like protein 2